MDNQIQGINALKNALNRLEAELNNNGYEIIDLTGHIYVDGLTVNVINAIKKKDTEKGKSYITKMVSPQIKYSGTVIAGGDVEITVPFENHENHDNIIKEDKNA